MVKRLDPELVVPIMGETDSLEKVAFNFLSNALKYTPRGGRIELGLEAPMPGESAKLYVQDSGPGSVKRGSRHSFRSLVRSKVGRRASMKERA